MRQERRVVCLATLSALNWPGQPIRQVQTKRRLGVPSTVGSTAEVDRAGFGMFDQALQRLGYPAFFAFETG